MSALFFLFRVALPALLTLCGAITTQEDAAEATMSWHLTSDGNVRQGGGDEEVIRRAAMARAAAKDSLLQESAAVREDLDQPHYGKYGQWSEIRYYTPHDSYAARIGRGLSESLVTLVDALGDGVEGSIKILTGEKIIHRFQEFTLEDLAVSGGMDKALLTKIPSFSKDANGCRNGHEEYYGQKCYKKCRLFTGNGNNNGGHTYRVGTNACAKTTCVELEEYFGGKCLKKCAELTSGSRPIRTGVNSCGLPSWSAHQVSSNYEVGYSVSNGMDVVNVQGQDCDGFTQESKAMTCCQGFNINSNDNYDAVTQCPYPPSAAR